MAGGSTMGGAVRPRVGWRPVPRRGLGAASARFIDSSCCTVRAFHTICRFRECCDWPRRPADPDRVAKPWARLGDWRRGGRSGRGRVQIWAVPELAITRHRTAPVCSRLVRPSPRTNPESESSPSCIEASASLVPGGTLTFPPLASPPPGAVSEPLTAFRITGGQTFLEAQAVEIIDQLQLPHVISWEKVDSIDGAFDAIKSMKVTNWDPSHLALRCCSCHPSPAFGILARRTPS